MLRPILPKPGGSQPPSEGPETSKKRKVISLACQRCRSRKVRCDGERPACSQCCSRGVSCHYDDDPGTTTRAYLRQEFQRIEHDQKDLLELYSMLKYRPEEEANAILRRLRQDDDVHSLMRSLKAEDAVPGLERSETHSPMTLDTGPPGLSIQATLNIQHPNAYPPLPPLSDPAAELGLRERSMTTEDSLGDDSLTEEDVQNARSLARPHQQYDRRFHDIVASRWTTVTENNTVIANLISLYISWDHATLRVLNEDYFLDELVSGGTDYCSPMLVNAMLCAASLNYTAIDPALSQALGPAFFEEARRLWHADEDNPSLMYVPAAIFLCMWCKSHDMEDLGTMYITQGIRAAENMGLFDEETRDVDQFDPSVRRYWEGRTVIAWGLFNWQTIHTFYMGAESMLPNPPYFPIREDLRSSDQAEQPWNSFPLIRPPQIMPEMLGFKAYSELFLILHHYLKTRVRIKPDSTNVDEFQIAYELHETMLSWADNLSSDLVRGPDSLPMVMDLHMFYHGIIIKVLRPFVGIDFPAQEQAREIMKASLAQLRRLLVLHRHRYDGPPFNSTTIGSVHILTSSLFEDLARTESIDRETAFYLVLCSEVMKKYGDIFPAVHKILYNLIAKARQSSTHLPEEIDTIFQELSGRLSQMEAAGPGLSRCPIDVQIAITDPHGVAMEDLVKATYTLEMNSEPYDSKGKGKGKEHRN